MVPWQVGGKASGLSGDAWANGHITSLHAQLLSYEGWACVATLQVLFKLNSMHRSLNKPLAMLVGHSPATEATGMDADGSRGPRLVAAAGGGLLNCGPCPTTLQPCKV